MVPALELAGCWQGLVAILELAGTRLGRERGSCKLGDPELSPSPPKTM